MDNQVDPHLHAAQNLRGIAETAKTAGLDYADSMSYDPSTSTRRRDLTTAELEQVISLASAVWQELWLRHLSDMLRRYGSAYGPWLPRDRSRAARRGNARYGPRRRFRA